MKLLHGTSDMITLNPIHYSKAHIAWALPTGNNAILIVHHFTIRQVQTKLNCDEAKLNIVAVHGANKWKKNNMKIVLRPDEIVRRVQQNFDLFFLAAEQYTESYDVLLLLLLLVFGSMWSDSTSLRMTSFARQTHVVLLSFSIFTFDAGAGVLRRQQSTIFHNESSCARASLVMPS